MTKEELKQKAEAEADKVIIGSGMDRASVIRLKHLLTTFYIQGYHAKATECIADLEKEAEEYAKKDCPDNFLCTRSIAKRGYLAGAESREKECAKAKEIIRELMNWYWETDIYSDIMPLELRQKTEQFLEENKE